MFVKIIYRHFVFNQEKYQVCKFRIYRHFVKSVNGSNFPVKFLETSVVNSGLRKPITLVSTRSKKAVLFKSETAKKKKKKTLKLKMGFEIIMRSGNSRAQSQILMTKGMESNTLLVTWMMGYANKSVTTVL